MKNAGFILFVLLLFVLLIGVSSTTLLLFSQQETHANHVAKTEFQLKHRAEHALQLLKTNFPASCVASCGGQILNNVSYKIDNIKQDNQGNRVYFFRLDIPTAGNAARLEVVEFFTAQDQHWQRMSWSYH